MNKEDQHFALTKLADMGNEPVTLAQAKNYLRVDFSEDDGLINTMIVAARTRAEQITGLSITQQQWRLTLDEFPRHHAPQHRIIRLPRCPVASVDQITYSDLLGIEQTLASSAFVVDATSQPARLAPVVGQSWPATRRTLGGVAITFTAGYATPSDVPATIVQAIMLMVSSMYSNREDIVVTTAQAQTLPRAAESLLAMHKVSRVGYEVIC